MHTTRTTDPWTYRETLGFDRSVDLAGFDVEAVDGGIGKVDEATYETSQSYIVVDTGPWIFGKKVMLPAGVIQRIDFDAQTVFVDRAKDEIKNSPEYEEHADETAYRSELGGYYYGEHSRDRDF